MELWLHHFDFHFSVKTPLKNPSRIASGVLFEAALARLNSLSDEEKIEAFGHVSSQKTEPQTMSDFIDMLPRKDDIFIRNGLTTRVKSVKDNCVSTYAGTFDLKAFMNEWIRIDEEEKVWPKKGERYISTKGTGTMLTVGNVINSWINTSYGSYTLEDFTQKWKKVN